MSEKKLNIEEIIDSQNIGEFKIKDYVSEDGYIHKAYKDAMLEFGKQLLELAVDNVLKVKYIETGKMDESVCDSILDTINQVE